MGEYLKKELSIHCKQDFVDHVRGVGMMVGVQMNKDGNSLVDKAREKGVLINVALGHGNTVRASVRHHQGRDR